MSESILELAEAYVSAGLSVIPIKIDGSKAPGIGQRHVQWQKFQEKRATKSELKKLFGGGRCGIGIACGKASEALEVIDFDDVKAYEEWRDIVDSQGMMPKMPLIKSPRGYHLYLKRIPGTNCAGNKKLAKVKLPDDSVKVTIETRGQGGQVVAPGSPPEVHPSMGLYEHHSGPQLTEWKDLHPIHDDEYQALMALAVSLTEVPDKKLQDDYDGPTKPGETRPGDDFNQRGDFGAIIRPYGWELEFERNGVEFWRRPGKDKGHSATAHKCRHPMLGFGLFYCFSSSAHPIESGRAYSPFQLFSLLNHNGDFSAAASNLRDLGFGGSSPANPHEIEAGLKALGVKVPKETQKALDQAKEESEEVDLHDRASVITKLRIDLGLPVLRLIQSAVEISPTYWLEIEGEDRIRLGSVSVLLSCREFEKALVIRMGKMLPAKAKKKGAWEKIAQMLISIREIEDSSRRELAEMLEWLEDYLQLGGRLLDDENWGEALEGNRPFVNKGCIWVHAENFQKFLNWERGRRMDDKEVRSRLREAGFESKFRSARTAEGTQVGRSYWFMDAAKLFPGYDAG